MRVLLLWTHLFLELQLKQHFYTELLTQDSSFTDSDKAVYALKLSTTRSIGTFCFAC